MKKIIFILLLIIIFLVFFGYMHIKTTEDNSEKVNVEEIIYDITNKDIQLDVISNNRDKWAKTEDLSNNIKCTVTDLDHNGRLEIIVSQMSGSGRFSINNFFEVNEDFTDLVQCKVDSEEGMSEADLSIMINADVYLDMKTNMFYYIVKDYMKSGLTESYDGTYALSLNRGIVREDYLTSAIIYYDYENDSNEKVVYADKYETDITEDEYNFFVENIYADCEKKTIKFNWINMLEIQDLEGEKLVETLETICSL